MSIGTYVFATVRRDSKELLDTVGDYVFSEDPMNFISVLSFTTCC